MADPIILQEIKGYILQFEYPLANSMTDEELAEIFNVSNRCFLISWMLKLFGIFNESVFGENLKMLGQIIYENGFCTKEQIMPFMNGTLDPSEQFKILENMFIYIKTIKKPISHTDLTPLSLTDLKKFSSNNLNLFPMYGEIKLLDHKNNQEKNLVQTENNEADCKETICKDRDIINLIEEIRLELPKMISISDNYQKNGIKQEYYFDAEAEKVLRKSNECIKNMFQFLEDLNTIDDFNKMEDLVVDNEHKLSGTNRALLREVYEEICEVLRSEGINKT